MDSRFKVCYAKHKFDAELARPGVWSGIGDAVSNGGSTCPQGETKAVGNEDQVLGSQGIHPDP
jgi:hypothetical protein